MRHDSDKERLKEIIDIKSNGTVDCRYKRKKDSTKDKFVKIMSFDSIIKI